METFIVYSSPAGSTQKVARSIEKELIAHGHTAFLFDLGRPAGAADAYNKIRNAAGDYSLFIGSPVYACHAVPPITDFIAKLPWATRGYAVLFITWGCVNSGLALHEMGVALTEKGYKIQGAAALPSVHSMLWHSEHPLGEGRPGKADEEAIQKFIGAVCEKIYSRTHNPVALSALNYQPETVRETMQKISLDAVRSVLPAKAADEKLCSKCGICATICPAAAITLSPYPVFGPACFLCYNCVRLCPEHAIAADFSLMGVNLQQRAASFKENPSPKLIY